LRTDFAIIVGTQPCDALRPFGIREVFTADILCLFAAKLELKIKRLAFVFRRPQLVVSVVGAPEEDEQWLIN